MSEETQVQTTAAKLGYPADARPLIINADDFGMCHDENEATIEGLRSGAFSSSTILVTCPWFEEAAEFARSTPSADLGVHLTLNAEWPRYKWGPVLGKSAVPSLADRRGYLWATVDLVYEHDQLDEVERELRAQIDKALDAGIDVTHLDCHMGPLQMRASYHEVYAKIARDFRLPIRMVPRWAMERLGMKDVLEQIERDGTFFPDNFINPGKRTPETTPAFWIELLRRLPKGISEIYCHPALARDELRNCANDPEQRDADFRFFTSDTARRLLRDEGIELVGYRRLRDAQRAAARS